MVAITYISTLLSVAHISMLGATQKGAYSHGVFNLGARLGLRVWIRVQVEPAREREPRQNDSNGISAMCTGAGCGSRSPRLLVHDEWSLIAGLSWLN